MVRLYQSTRTNSDACEVRRQALQQEAPLKFRTTVPPSSVAGITPVDSTIVYAERPVYDRYALGVGKLTHDRSRDNLQVRGLGIPTLPSQVSGPLLNAAEIDQEIRSHPQGVVNACGRFVVDPRTFEVLAPKALIDVPNLPAFPASTRADQRDHWIGCEATFQKEIKGYGAHL